MIMVEKIKFDEFLENYDIILSYAIRHMINEDWNEYDGSLFTSEVFDTMQYYILAGKKCLEYKDIFNDYVKTDKRIRGCVFLDEK